MRRKRKQEVDHWERGGDKKMPQSAFKNTVIGVTVIVAPWGKALRRSYWWRKWG